MLSKTRSAPVYSPAPGVIPERRGVGAPAAGPTARDPAMKADPTRTCICPECGHALRVSGLGRHRVYFELDHERVDHPIMKRVCPECGRSLPEKTGRDPRHATN